MVATVPGIKREGRESGNLLCAIDATRSDTATSGKA